MSLDWYIGVREFCGHWRNAPMLQQTLETLEKEFEADNDACIDAAKALVECACRVIIDNLDDPAAPLRPTEENPSFGSWVSAAVRVLDLDQIRDNAFKKLISQYYKLTSALGELRNSSGTVSHGKDGFLKKLSRHQRRSAVLVADAIITFLHEAYLEREPELIRSREPYTRFSKSNALIDSNVAVSAVEDRESATVLIDIHLPNGDSIQLAVEASRVLYEFDREAYIVALLAAKEAELATNASEEGEDA